MASYNSIKVSHDIYLRLGNLKGKGDSFSSVINGLLEILDSAGEMEELLRTLTVFSGWKREQLERKVQIFG